MSNRMEVYKCEKGMVIEVLNGEACTIECCGEAMELLAEQTADAATEKHVPIVEAIAGGMKVKVGSVAHPMTEEHSIQWIEVINGDYVNRKYLKPGDAPEAVFYVPIQDGMIIREYCNVHGLWKNEQ